MWTKCQTALEVKKNRAHHLQKPLCDIPECYAIKISELLAIVKQSYLYILSLLEYLKLNTNLTQSSFLSNCLYLLCQKN